MYAGIGTAKLKFVQYLLSDIVGFFFPSACTSFATALGGKVRDHTFLGFPAKLL